MNLSFTTLKHFFLIYHFMLFYLFCLSKVFLSLFVVFQTQVHSPARVGYLWPDAALISFFELPPVYFITYKVTKLKQ